MKNVSFLVPVECLKNDALDPLEYESKSFTIQLKSNDNYEIKSKLMDFVIENLNLEF